jgi:4-carboxymuconolactone decarboxylase
LKEDEAQVFRFCSELLATRRVSDETFAATKAAFGERGIVDLMATMSYYTLVAMALNVDRYPVT